MTIDEAIKHAEEVADYDCYNEKQLKCAEEHRQLAEWLKELKENEGVLDKIRAEIEQITDTMGVSYNQYVSKIDVLQIIDKYRADKEGE